MNLEFVKDGNVFVAEFEVAGDFNLHVERPASGLFSVYQRTAQSGKYAYVEGLGSQTGKDVIEYDFTGVIYPKSIRVVSEVNPTLAVVTFTGDAPSGGGSTEELKRNDVNFFDYDGTLLYSYSWEKARNLTELPAAPSHEGMTFKEWNYTLEDIKEQGTDTYIGKADVGAVFVDGSGIQIESPKDVIIFPRGTEFIDEMSHSYKIVSVLSIPNTVNTIAYRAFYFCTFRDRVVLPSSVTEWDVDGYYSFDYCNSPYYIWDNTHKTTLMKSINAVNLVVEIPEWYTDVISAGLGFSGCTVIVPKNIRNLENPFGGYFDIILYFEDREDIPTAQIDMNLMGNLYVVPDNLYNEWIVSTNWVGANIVKRSEYGNL